MFGFSPSHLLEMALMAVVLLFSVVVHEVAHGYVALRNGDPTAKMLGRLTLNPVPHIDPIGTILLPALLLISGAGIIFGWAKPVPVNPLNFRNYRWGEITVSAAGPLSNLALAVIFSYVLQLGPPNIGLMKMALWGVQINIFLALFNLIPIPPLDGSHIVSTLLPRDLARMYAYLEPVGFILILVLFYTGIMGMFLMPVYRLIASFLLG
ncbi:MAG: site-2 protease family protein [Deltaproteobacteria bacterium]|nr:MAG: site-2 protease family protein [Deltaproteobacteria bacterium]